MIEPFSPVQAKQARDDSIPEIMLDVINKLLAHNYNDNRIIIKLSDLKNKLAHAGYTGQIQNHWLDFEDIYRKQGWRVRCDVPGFNESYETYWEFYPSQCWEESEV